MNSGTSWRRNKRAVKHVSSSPKVKSPKKQSVKYHKTTNHGIQNRTKEFLSSSLRKTSIPRLISVCAAIVLIGSIGSYWFIDSTETKLQAELENLKQETTNTDAKLKSLQNRIQLETDYNNFAYKQAEQSVSSGYAHTAESNISLTSSHTDPAKLDVVVNKQHPVYPLDFSPLLHEAECGNGDVALFVPAAVKDFEEMCAAATTAGHPLVVTSSYRSYSDQNATYAWWTASDGRKVADTYSALPGYSEHQLGLSVDLATDGGLGLSDFTGTPEQKWLSDNAYKYGFIQRYTEAGKYVTGFDAESWHFRYVGRDVAKKYHDQKSTSLEEFWRLSGGTYDKRVFPN